jgi:hypothetical protein
MTSTLFERTSVSFVLCRFELDQCRVPLDRRGDNGAEAFARRLPTSQRQDRISREVDRHRRAGRRRELRRRADAESGRCRRK